MRAPHVALLTFALLGFVLPAAVANHVQHRTVNNVLHSVQFDHDGDNDWWVEVLVKDVEGDHAVTVEARPEGGTYHHLQHKALVNGWHKWGTNTQDMFRIPPGERVQFRAFVIDAGTGNGQFVESCAFTHPDGVEQCTSPPPFDAGFTGVRGNEWWIQAFVSTNGPLVSKVEVTLDKGATWKPLEKKSWGGWATSTRIVDGTVVRLRAAASDGQMDLSSCRQWIPPSNQDAQIVDCGGTTTQPFDATYSNVRGNEWWVEAVIAANRPVTHVFVYFGDCSNEPADMTYHPEWGKWALGVHVPAGTKVVLEAFGGEGAGDPSGGYIWPQATPTSGCPQPAAWPERGVSYVDYFVDIGGRTKDVMDVHFFYDTNGVWQVTCEVDHFDHNTGETTESTVKASFPPPTAPTQVTFGQDVDVGTIGHCAPDGFGATPEKAGAYEVKVDGNTVQAATWEGGFTCSCYHKWSQNTGLTFSWDVVGTTFHSVGRMKDTDAPLKVVTPTA